MVNDVWKAWQGLGISSEQWEHHCFFPQNLLLYPEDGGGMCLWNVGNTYQSTWHHIPEDHNLLSILLVIFGNTILICNFCCKWIHIFRFQCWVLVFVMCLKLNPLFVVLAICCFWMDGVVQMLMNVRRTRASVMVESAPIHQEVIHVSALRACFQVQTAHHV